MRELVRLADYKAVEGVAGVELVVAALKIQPGLFHRRTGGGRTGRNRLFLSADVLHAGIRHAQFVKYRLNDLPVGTGEDLAKHGCGDLDVENVALRAAQARRLKPGRKSINADAGFDAVQKPVP